MNKQETHADTVQNELARIGINQESVLGSVLRSAGKLIGILEIKDTKTRAEGPLEAILAMIRTSTEESLEGKCRAAKDVRVTPIPDRKQ